MPTHTPDPAEVQRIARLRRTAAERSAGLRLEVSRGRLEVYNAGERLLADVRGAAYDRAQGRWELSLTLPTLRAVRQQLGLDRTQFARHCAPALLDWARVAGGAEQRVLDLHQRMSTGYRTDLPWHDAQANVSGWVDRAYRAVGCPEADPPYRPPFAHQQIMATVACELDGAALLCEMGTGKTRSAAEAAAHQLRQGAIDVLVVVCPQRVMPTWKRELAQWTVEWRPALMLEGTVVQRRAALAALAALQPAQRRAQTVIVNYDVLHLLAPAIEALCRSCRVGLIADEMHKVANANAKRTKALLRLAPRAAWRLGLTGTPVKGGAHDLWSQWYLVDLGLEFGANYVQFRREWVDENPYAHTITLREGSAEQIRARLARRGVRFLKEEAALYEGPMTDAQARAYREMEDTLVARLGPLREGQLSDEDVASAATQLTMILRLSQITSGFVKTEAGTIHRFEPNAKLLLIDEPVRDAIESGRSVILWAWYREDQDLLLRHFAAYRPVAIRGGQSLREHAAVESAFQREDTRLCIANQASGGSGITLTAASFALYYSQGYSLIDRIQSEDRCHRPGSERHTSITIADAVLSGTVDEVVREAIALKKSTAETLLALRRHLESA
jgi:SWI/SNF-related matrix-associated actin-dependent regulator 1 of chromatin subfamily A